MIKMRVLLMALLAWAPLAQATLLWNYSYSGAGASGSGYLTTSSNLQGGSYAITGISGMRGDQPVESLLAAGTYPTSGGSVLNSDNRLHPSAPFLGTGGFTSVVGSDLVNVYFQVDSYFDLAGSDCNPDTCGSMFFGTPVTFTATLVPSREWRFAYSGDGVSASGTLVTPATPSLGQYDIVGLFGERNGQAMNALLPPGDYPAAGGSALHSDNLLSLVAPNLDLLGFTFHAGDDRYNVYYSGGAYYDLAGIDCGDGCGRPGHLGTPVTFTLLPVPEPPAAALLLAAMAALVVVRPGRRRPAAQIQ